jgi:hypothetical protein
MGYRSNSPAVRRVEDLPNRKYRPRARDIILSWTRAREYREGQARYLRVARWSSDPDMRDRFITVAEHYRSLAEIEQNIADQRPYKKARKRYETR